MAPLQPSGDTCLGGTHAKSRDQVLSAPPPLSQRYDLTLNEERLYTRVGLQKNKGLQSSDQLFTNGSNMQTFLQPDI